MRWTMPMPKTGQRKFIKRFAWVPMRIGDTVIWLEHYMVWYEWKDDQIGWWVINIETLP